MIKLWRRDISSGETDRLLPEGIKLTNAAEASQSASNPISELR
jgi:hypothetical protein